MIIIIFSAKAQSATVPKQFFIDKSGPKTSKIIAFEAYFQLRNFLVQPY